MDKYLEEMAKEKASSVVFTKEAFMGWGTLARWGSKLIPSWKGIKSFGNAIGKNVVLPTAGFSLADSFFSNPARKQHESELRGMVNQVQGLDRNIQSNLDKYQNYFNPGTQDYLASAKNTKLQQNEKGYVGNWE